MQGLDIDDDSQFFLREIRNIARNRQRGSSKDNVADDDNHEKSLKISPADSVTKSYIKQLDNSVRTINATPVKRTVQVLHKQRSLTPTTIDTAQTSTANTSVRHFNRVSKIPTPIIVNGESSVFNTISYVPNGSAHSSFKSKDMPIHTFGNSTSYSSHLQLPVLASTDASLMHQSTNPETETNNHRRSHRRSRLPLLIRPSSITFNIKHRSSSETTGEQDIIEPQTDSKLNNGLYISTTDAELDVSTDSHGTSLNNRRHSSANYEAITKSSSHFTEVNVSNNNSHLPSAHAHHYHTSENKHVDTNIYHSGHMVTHAEMRHTQPKAYKSVLKKTSGSANRRRKRVHFEPNLELVRIVSKIEYPWYRQSRLNSTRLSDIPFTDYSFQHPL